MDNRILSAYTDWVRLTGNNHNIQSYKNTLKTTEKIVNAAEKNITNRIRELIVLEAPEKSGKRIMMELFSLTLGRLYKVYYYTSFRRNDMKQQLVNLKELFDIPYYTSPIRLEIDINQHKGNNTGIHPIVFFDESDYGTGKKQNFSSVFTTMFNGDVQFISFSATNKEAALSNIPKQIIQHIPDNDYIGFDWYHNNGLWTQTNDTFFDNINTNLTMSSNATNIIKSMKKNIGIIRISSDKKHPKIDLTSLRSEIYNKTGRHLAYLEVINHTKKSSYPFTKDKHTGGQCLLTSLQQLFIKNPQDIVLIFIKQMCVRGTQLDGLDLLDFMYDVRTDASHISTLSQALGRLCHYKGMYPPDSVNVRVYCNKSYSDMSNLNGTYSDRVGEEKENYSCIYDVLKYNTLEDAKKDEENYRSSTEFLNMVSDISDIQSKMDKKYLVFNESEQKEGKFDHNKENVKIQNDINEKCSSTKPFGMGVVNQSVFNLTNGDVVRYKLVSREKIDRKLVTKPSSMYTQP